MRTASDLDQEKHRDLHLSGQQLYVITVLNHNAIVYYFTATSARQRTVGDISASGLPYKNVLVYDRLRAPSGSKTSRTGSEGSGGK